jgi:hypothetical protein
VRWPWQARATAAEQVQQREHEQRQQEATEAVASAEQALREARSRWPEVRQLADDARRIREENHLADLVRRNLRGRHA